MQTQVFGGFRYVKLEEKLTAHLTLQPDSLFEGVSRNLNTNLERDFKGIGPQVGTKVFLPLTRCFGVTGKLAGSFLHGDQHFHLRNHLFESLLGTPETNFVSDDGHRHHDDRHWIPNLSTYVGLGYQIQLCDCSCLMLEAGYRYECYFNILNQEHFSDCSVCDCHAKHDHHDHDNFDFHGPYLQLSWHL